MMKIQACGPWLLASLQAVNMAVLDGAFGGAAFGRHGVSTSEVGICWGLIVSPKQNHVYEYIHVFLYVICVCFISLVMYLFVCLFMYLFIFTMYNASNLSAFKCVKTWIIVQEPLKRRASRCLLDSFQEQGMPSLKLTSRLFPCFSNLLQPSLSSVQQA